VIAAVNAISEMFTVAWLDATVATDPLARQQS
jgi:hypothetical protein